MKPPGHHISTGHIICSSPYISPKINAYPFVFLAAGGFPSYTGKREDVVRRVAHIEKNESVRTPPLTPPSSTQLHLHAWMQKWRQRIKNYIITTPFFATDSKRVVARRSVLFLFHAILKTVDIYYSLSLNINTRVLFCYIYFVATHLPPDLSMWM
ncbi:hypothetical protein DL89DRAFT_74967 [Linderina pennispora]|uniref:Uncharacterized protein n=1 Tax=Linderina pennispora TaxID=61395 RepID=A0A1Y1VXT2_9FUNG|nr:uncharacterized protein DL89DRAFT_74967 [Linderina pennispora]ORX66013.1 hypothetical protein DL89DRAFT_74967 [Linderina pennispora]